MKKRKIGLLWIAVFVGALFSPWTSLADTGVRVQLPDFPVKLNGTAVNNSIRKYPLIVYKDITYFPLTYYDCRFLGLETAWSSEEGLAISKMGFNWEYRQQETVKSNQKSGTATIPSFGITINGKTIENGREEYPLLLFRDVTYFPLTWRFAVDEFGWKYSFDEKNGLVLHSSGKTAQVHSVQLPIWSGGDWYKGAFAMAGEYFYYQGSQNAIYQVPVAHMDRKKKVYDLPMNYDAGTPVLSSLRTKNGEMLLNYHMGGAVMGSDFLFLLKEDGTWEKLVEGNGFYYKKIGDHQIRVDQYVVGDHSNLNIKKLGDQEYKRVGAPRYSYGYSIIPKNGSTEVGPSEDVYLLDGEIYILGNSDKDNPASATGIVKVNAGTGKTVRACQEAAESFKMAGDTIYFKDLSQHLHMVSAKGGKSRKIMEEAVSFYGVLGNKLYYSLKDRGDQLYIHGVKDCVNPGGQLKGLEEQEGYMVATFAKESKGLYKTMIFDKTGSVLYKTMDQPDQISIDGDKAALVKGREVRVIDLLALK